MNLNPNTEPGFAMLVQLRGQYALGGPYWTPDKLCQSRAKSTGQQCRRVPVRGSKRCQYHGGYSSSAIRANRGRPGRLKAERRGWIQRSLDTWSAEIRAKYGSARAAIASLPPDQSKHAMAIMRQFWPRAAHRNRKGQEAAAHLILRYVTGALSLQQMERQWALLDPGISAAFAERQPAT